MSVGFRVFNDDGISQIMDTARNLVMTGKGQTSTGNTAGFGASGGITNAVTFSHDGPVMFAAHAPSGAAAVVTSKQGTTYTFHAILGNRPETATWYAFSYPKPSTSTSGLRVFNAAGQLAYDSAQKPLRIVAPFNIGVNPTPGAYPVNNMPTWPPHPGDVWFPAQRSDRTYAALALGFPPHRVWYKYKIANKVYLALTGYFYYLPIAWGNSIRLIARFVTAGNGQTTPVGTFPYGGLSLYQGVSSYAQTGWIIDVTGY